MGTCLATLGFLPCAAPQSHATPPLIDPPSGVFVDPGPPPSEAAQPGSPILPNGPGLPPPVPMRASWQMRERQPNDLPEEAAALRAAMAQEVAGVVVPSHRLTAEIAARAVTMLGMTGTSIDKPQLAIVVDRNPAVERLYLMLARPGDGAAWRAIGSVHVSTGQAGRKDYYITPLGVFPHTDAILDFRALGTYNEHHVRGLGVAGMRVWDFGWQWAKKGWHTDGEGGDIRLMMHATDPVLLEGRLGRPASEGCVRLSSSMNRFLDHHGVLDADDEVRAVQDVRYRALLAPDRTPTPLAGRLLIVIDTSLPPDTPPTASSRPPDWPSPPPSQSATVGAPGTETGPD